MTARTAVVTLAHGRHDHLAGQLWGLRRQEQRPDIYVCVAVDDPLVPDVVAEHAARDWQVATPSLPAQTGGLPLAAARNLGAATAAEHGADVLVFLDVDCIPAPTLVRRYAAVLTGTRPREPGPVVLAGEVGYLPPVDHPRDYRGADLAALARPHAARPLLTADELRVAVDLRLFWSLSFAVGAADWVRLGGFCEDYVGYGGEDTDFGQRLGAAGGTLLWVGGAPAYHQHHPSPDPPLQHLEPIVRNANLFHRQWGWFPMEGWLARFAELGLIRLEEGAGSPRWALLVPPPDEAGSLPDGSPELGLAGVAFGEVGQTP